MNSLKELKKFFLRYKGLLLAGFFCVLISNLFRIVTPPLTGWVIDHLVLLLKHGSDMNSVSQKSPFFFFIFFKNYPLRHAVLYGIIAIFLLAFLSGIFMFLMRQTLIVMSRNIEYDQKNEIYSHYQRLDAGFLQKQSTGDLMNRISEDVSRVRMFTGPALMYLINLFCVIGMSLFFMFHADSRLTLITLSPLPFLALIIYRVNLFIQSQSDKIQAKLSELTAHAQQAYSGIRLIKSYLRENTLRKLFETNVEDYTKESLKLSRVESFYFPSISLLMGISTLLTIGAGTLDIIQARPGASVGHVVEFLLYIQMLMFPVSAIGWSASMIKRAEVSQRRINEFLAVSPGIKDEPHAPRPILHGKISFHNLSFTYPGASSAALDHIQLEINSGEKVAVVGKTGSGKTTLAKIILRMYDPQQGKYLMDGFQASSVSLQHLRSHFAYVPQDILLFSDTIRNNICFAVQDYTENELMKAVHLSCLAEELSQMKDGIETLVGERGITLSGGQRQRVAIARALMMKNAVVTVFDDCLSAVDAATEERLFKNMGDFLKQKTTIFITHRLHHLHHYDRIILMDNAKIVEMGTHAELMGIKGLYYRQYMQQQLDITEQKKDS